MKESKEASLSASYQAFRCWAPRILPAEPTRGDAADPDLERERERDTAHAVRVEIQFKFN